MLLPDESVPNPPLFTILASDPKFDIVLNHAATLNFESFKLCVLGMETTSLWLFIVKNGS